MSRHLGRSVLLCLGVSVLAACGEGPASSSSGLDEYGSSHRGERNPGLTPGDLCDREDADFDGLRYPEQIAHCRRDVSTDRKIAIAAAYGIYGETRHNYEIDHFIPLNIGGNNGDRNLWPLFGPYARQKSQYEYWLMERVAKGELRQVEAIERIKAWRPGLQQGNDAE